MPREASLLAQMHVLRAAQGLYPLMAWQKRRKAALRASPASGSSPRAGIGAIRRRSDQAALLDGGEQVASFTPAAFNLDTFRSAAISASAAAEVDQSPLFAVSSSTSLVTVVVSAAGASPAGLALGELYRARLVVEGKAGKRTERGALDFTAWLEAEASADGDGSCP